MLEWTPASSPLPVNKQSSIIPKCILYLLQILFSCKEDFGFPSLAFSPTAFLIFFLFSFMSGWMLALLVSSSLISFLGLLTSWTEKKLKNSTWEVSHGTTEAWLDRDAGEIGVKRKTTFCSPCLQGELQNLVPRLRRTSLKCWEGKEGDSFTAMKSWLKRHLENSFLPLEKQAVSLLVIPTGSP